MEAENVEPMANPHGAPVCVYRVAEGQLMFNEGKCSLLP